MMTHAQLIKEIRRYQPAELALLLGAGASKSSGVPLASEMIDEWRRDIFDADAADDERAGTVEEWFGSRRDAYPWFQRDEEYSKLFERCYRTRERRQKYIEEKTEVGRPGWGYLYLANLIVQARRFTTIFTTNFDDLINQALSGFLHHHAVVCTADSEVDNISFLSDRAKIIKLHGDYLFLDIRNTEDELRALGEKMAAKFSELLKRSGLVVIGYAGRDQSVMSMLELLLEDPKSFPYSLYWGVRPKETPSSRVAALAKKHDRFQLFECPDFDSFMAGLHAELKLELPATIVSPHSQLEAQLQPLVLSTAIADAAIKRHVEQLRGQLGRPTEAELALSRRDYAAAIRLAEAHVQSHGAGSPAFTVWGEALMVQADEEGRADVLGEAVKKLEQAIAADPSALPPRSALARLYTRRQMVPEAIRAGEALRELSPNDHGMRRSLAQLYVQEQRLADAEREVEWLTAHEAPAADIHAMRAAIRNAQGRTGEAIEEMRRAVRLAGDNASLRYNLGQLLASQQRIDEAEAEFQTAARLAPDNALCLMAVAQVLWMRQRPAEALQFLERASQFNPNSAEVRGRLGEVYLQMGRAADAERETAAAMALAPEDARIKANMGTILLHVNRIGEAETMLTQARDLNPALPQPHYFLGLMYAQQGRIPELNGVLQRLQAIQPMLAQQLQMQAMQLQAQQQQGQWGQQQGWGRERLPPQWAQYVQNAQQQLQQPQQGGWPAPGQNAGPSSQNFWAKLFGGS